MSNVYCIKTPYDTADAAESAMRRVARTKAGKKYGSSKMASYRCEICGNFHWGHYGSTSTPKCKTKRKVKRNEL